MLRLLASYPWGRSSVQAICLEANESRSNFYNHYANKDALLEAGFVLLEAQLKSTGGAVSPDGGAFGFMEPPVAHVSANRSAFAHNSRDPEAFAISDGFLAMLIRLVMREFHRTGTPDHCVPFIAGGIHTSLVA